MTATLIPVEGTYNFRDLGGYSADGGVIRPRTLFRSDALHRLSDHGREQLVDLGVGRVIDLRDDRERERLPDELPERTQLLACPIFPDAAAHVSAQLDIFALTELIYLQHGDTVASAIALLAEDPAEHPTGAPGAETGPDAWATVFHCTAGKDRTGAVAAMTLLAAGVSRDDVVADYAISAEYLRGPWLDQHLDMLRGLGVEVTPVIEQLVGDTPTAAIERALADVEREYGSARDYLLANGLGETALERLHARLVTAG